MDTADTLKLAYRYTLGDHEIGTEELLDRLCDALCEELGDDGFQRFVNELRDDVA